MNIVFSKKSNADLLSIAAFIYLNNPDHSKTFTQELVERCKSLMDMPRAYPLVERYKKSDVRRCTHGDYLIFYRISENSIIVTRILNGARDYNSLPLDL